MPPLLTALPELDLEVVPKVRKFRTVPVAGGVQFHQLVVTGPPGAGKSTFIRSVGGWPEEGYADISRKGWWRAQALTVRPREIHLGLPFAGRETGLALFEQDWLDAWNDLVLDEGRIWMPPEKHFILAVNWHRRFVFEFLLPPPAVIEADRRERAREGTHPVDQNIDVDQISAQVELFGRVAACFHRHGMQVYVRERVEDRPLRFVAPSQDPP